MRVVAFETRQMIYTQFLNPLSLVESTGGKKQ